MKSGIIFHGNDISYGNFPDTVQTFQQIFASSFSISMNVLLRLQISSFFRRSDVITKQNKILQKSRTNKLGK